MGRGRQKAKQQKIARKLKYLTTDTDYDELAKELSSQEQTADSVDKAEGTNKAAGTEDAHVRKPAEARTSAEADKKAQASAEDSSDEAGDGIDDDLDEYARWAAEAAAKATSGELPAIKPRAAKHKPIPMPLPSVLKPGRLNKGTAAK